MIYHSVTMRHRDWVSGELVIVPTKVLDESSGGTSTPTVSRILAHTILGWVIQGCRGYYEKEGGMCSSTSRTPCSNCDMGILQKFQVQIAQKMQARNCVCIVFVRLTYALCFSYTLNID